MGSGEGGRSRAAGAGHQRAAARSARTSRQSRPTVTAAVVTVIGLVVVAFLALQASHSAQTAAAIGSSQSPGPTTQAPPVPVIPPIPANAGTGRRIVYSVGQTRVWITGTDGTVIGTFKATPGFEPPTIGHTYSVSSHSRQGLGNDGRLYQYGTFFGETDDGYTLAFNTVDMTTPTNRPTSLPPEPATFGGTAGWHAQNAAAQATSRTAAIRVGLYQADLIYYHSPLGTKVYVVA